MPNPHPDAYSHAATVVERHADKIAEAGALIANRIAADPTRPVCHEFCPGTGSRYALVLTPAEGIEEGNRCIFGVGDDGWLLSFPDYGTTYPINLAGNYCSANYAAEKWMNDNAMDGSIIGALLTEIRERLNA